MVSVHRKDKANNMYQIQQEDRMNSSRVAFRLREQIDYFSGELSKGLPKTAQRFVREMIYGIQARQSVMLTEVARALEEPIRLKKSHDRLSRQLSREGLGKVLGDNLLARAAKHIKEDTLLIIDPTDISKKYAKHMQYLAEVRDGSAGQISDGYWVCSVVGAREDSDEIIPLYQHLYSAKAPDFISENAEILRCVDTICRYIGERGIWVMDRGGDRGELIKPFLEKSKKFLIRLVGNRHLIYNGKAQLAEDIAAGCWCPYSETVVKEEKGQERVFHIEFGFRKVLFPDHKGALYLLVIKGLGQDPLILLSSVALRRSRKVLWKMIKRYLRRWAIEETIRFWKQSYDVENIRVLGYRSLQNMMSLILVVSYFATKVLDVGSKLKITAAYVLKAAKRVFGIPDFRYYAIADGLRNLFMRHPGKPYRKFAPKWIELTPQRQLF
jgi:hypothetical protein